MKTIEKKAVYEQPKMNVFELEPVNLTVSSGASAGTDDMGEEQ